MLISYTRRQGLDIEYERVKDSVEILGTIYCDFEDFLGIFPSKGGWDHTHEILFWITNDGTRIGTAPVWILKYKSQQGFYITDGGSK
jgi:hypothetical protein